MMSSSSRVVVRGGGVARSGSGGVERGGVEGGGVEGVVSSGVYGSGVAVVGRDKTEDTRAG